MPKRKSKKTTSKPNWKYHTVGRTKNLKKAQTIKKAYPLSGGYRGTKIFKQKSGYAVKIRAPRG